jgi:SAM-dependent methyltransferase
MFGRQPDILKQPSNFWRNYGGKVMQAYGEIFARIYNERWAGFANGLASPLLNFYAGLAISQENKRVLDLCCGTGQLARCLLDEGYQVIGIDLSEHMLKYARENTAAYLPTGQAQFIQGDATDFSLDVEVGLVVSTYDALNHLPDFTALQNCFTCVYRVLAPGGAFVFDLNTRQGLFRWNSIHVMNEPDFVLINRGVYDGGERAYVKLSGFVQTENGLYQRSESSFYNTVFEMTAVREALFATGWQDVYYATYQDLKTPLAEPEMHGRVFFVAMK